MPKCIICGLEVYGGYRRNFDRGKAWPCHPECYEDYLIEYGDEDES